MTLRFEQPLWMYAALVIVPLGVVAWRWFVGMSAGRRWSAVILRGVLLALLAAMLAGLSSVRRTERLAVVAVVDASESVRRFGRGAAPDGGDEDALTRAGRFLASATAKRGPDDLLGIVVFDGRATAVATPSRGDVTGRSLDVRAGEGTDIASAVRLARALLPADAAGRLVLISDGNETEGDARRSAAETAGLARAGAGALGVPIDVAPVRYRVDREVMVESVDAPPNAAWESTVSVRVVLNSTAGSTGTLRLLREGKPVVMGADDAGRATMGRRLTLSPGRHVEVVDVPLDEGRVHRFRAVYEPDPVTGPDGVQTFSGDTTAENNAGESFTITPGKGTVLLVHGAGDGSEPASGGPLAGALRAHAIEVQETPAAEMPGDLLSLQAFDLVILDNVAAEEIPAEGHARLSAYVREMGGGLVMVGGPDSFGAGGWTGTAVEPLLPVRLDLPEKVTTPEAATIFVIDNSGSMNWAAIGTGKSKQEIANEATALAISRLDRNDLVGVITFNNDFDVVIPLSRNGKPDVSAARVRGIGAGGGTFMGPALEEAGLQIEHAEAKVKHVIVLSDGRSRERESLVPIAARLGERGIKVSTIAVGDDADTEVMREMATRGGGEFFDVYNANALPRIFLKAVRLVRSPLIREAPFEPVILPTGSPLVAGLARPPALNGLVLTRARTEPTAVNAMVTPQGEPVLSHWNVELGRVAAFTSGSSRWAEEWLAWAGYAQLWTQTVRQVSRPAAGRLLRGEARVDGAAVHVRIQALDDDGHPMDFLSMPGSVYFPSGRQEALSLAQTAPGVYEGEAPLAEHGTVMVVIRPSSTGGMALSPVITGVSAAEGAELRSLASNDALMESIAETTGGRVLDLDTPHAAKLFDRAGVRPQEAVTPLWPLLLPWAIIALLLDIATRRIAWDRWWSREFGAEWTADAAASLRDRGRQAREAMEALRGRRDGPAADSSLSLSREDAEALVRAARDRRRAARLGDATVTDAVRATRGAPAGEAATTTAGEPPANEDHGLLAAKRRAARRFEEESSPGGGESGGTSGEPRNDR